MLATGFTKKKRAILQEALDVTKHLPLALVGDKVLVLIIVLPFYYGGQSNCE
jgi:hypothetical protein